MNFVYLIAFSLTSFLNSLLCVCLHGLDFKFVLFCMQKLIPILRDGLFPLDVLLFSVSFLTFRFFFFILHISAYKNSNINTFIVCDMPVGKEKKLFASKSPGMCILMFFLTIPSIFFFFSWNEWAHRNLASSMKKALIVNRIHWLWYFIHLLEFFVSFKTSFFCVLY